MAKSEQKQKKEKQKRRPHKLSYIVKVIALATTAVVLPIWWYKSDAAIKEAGRQNDKKLAQKSAQKLAATKHNELYGQMESGFTDPEQIAIAHIQANLRRITTYDTEAKKRDDQYKPIAYKGPIDGKLNAATIKSLDNMCGNPLFNISKHDCYPEFYGTQYAEPMMVITQKAFSDIDKEVCATPADLKTDFCQTDRYKVTLTPTPPTKTPTPQKAHSKLSKPEA